MTSKWRSLALSAPAALLLLFFFVVPMTLLVRVSLYEDGSRSGFGIGSGFYRPDTWTLDAYRTLLTEEYFHSILVFTLQLAVAVIIVTLAIAYPLALYIHTLRPRWKLIALSAVVLPKLANLLVVVYGLELILSNTGPINTVLLGIGLIGEPVELFHNLTGVMIGKTYLIVPYAVLVLVAALGRIDPDLLPAARGLGADRMRGFLRVTLPLSAPGLALAAMISLIWALGAFVSPYLLGSPQEITLAVEVQRQTFENINWPRGAATAVIMLVALAAVMGLFHMLVRAARRRFEASE